LSRLMVIHLRPWRSTPSFSAVISTAVLKGQVNNARFVLE
jgi:hypothetical protein